MVKIVYKIIDPEYTELLPDNLFKGSQVLSYYKEDGFIIVGRYGTNKSTLKKILKDYLISYYT